MAFYKYKDVPLSLIYSSNDPYVAQQNITNFKENDVTLNFDPPNGRYSRQKTLVPLYNFPEPFSAFFVEYTVPGIHVIPRSYYENCSSLKVMMVGGGGSGGAGGGDTEDKKGTDGSGGGGGALNDVVINNPKQYNLRVYVGSGGSSVSGASSGNNGKDGNNGENSNIQNFNEYSYSVLGFAKKGGGGGGGHPTSTAEIGVGGTYTPHIGGFGVTSGPLMDLTYNGDGYDSQGMNGMPSGLYRNHDDFGFENDYYFPLIGYDTYKYGDAGNGTPRGHAPNSTATGAGKSGYVRVYFIY